MNCLEYRRRLLSEPRNSDDAFNGHAKECAPCQRFAQQTSAIEEYERVVKILLAKGLAGRILLNRKRNLAPAYRIPAAALALIIAIASHGSCPCAHWYRPARCGTSRGEKLREKSLYTLVPICKNQWGS